ncbi:KRAB-A domain-containing protein 2-like [Gossypium australe]|uniref:KRAB-A domain-containing protein 2-like n=1 Tax=Gossypium australe TaxID=47621 RepID=A0A5B6WQ49_9ROSI|nr:KRAB-A domain-containing protein 2-like [Gossypium australe]
MAYENAKLYKERSKIQHDTRKETSCQDIRTIDRKSRFTSWCNRTYQKWATTFPCQWVESKPLFWRVNNGSC